ncbi:DUF2845 domain-containing protein [Piscinibacter gummiphilus]|uniref:Uncharacterized protein n=1 Tax=Piscinibacter gummiphilus TaxID=946333 RepID=A0A1W6L5U2_9BURK|nr:DUF2845 domain-containing protein [Piscinibacter gummiphilus]ARN19550.1 hypothetical protein A4W93_06280 [Piscinibacter gummiphilus]GLS92801.1 hypothetical protein GCM10007918_00920 [Piscinibacter gummiphilus]
MRFTPAHAALALALGLASGATFAQNLRCGNNFADPGDSKMSVLSKCGEPAVRDSFCKPDPAPPPRDGSVRPCINVDSWAYRPGRGQFITILEFEEGTLRTIRYGDRIP